ncbi:MAG: DNA polymerase III subunit gamma/tau [Planctomycetota bacterium]|jgi:DNA polymerase-3 subunit gamma/tau
MSYTVLARRYRSRSFDQVVGQDAIAQTLRNAIEQDRVAHAYLFVGTRGVGKTSTARIFAKALNCPDDEPRDVAQAIMEGNDTDVIEIDAASNNKVEEARELIANAGYRPLRGKHKIYIIDEVHMLSKAAFNALLKTMEEPPSHVKFVLCTTDPEKVPPTIQSRCQRFDFRNISQSQIAAHLGEVLKSEGVEGEAELLNMVARMGAGSMRDALSLLDRILAATPAGETLTRDTLEKLFGLPPQDVIVSMLEAMRDQDCAKTLGLADSLLQRGISYEQVLGSLLDMLHTMLLVRTCGIDSELVDISDTNRGAIEELAPAFETSSVVHMMVLCESVQRTMRNAAMPRAIFDALLVRMATTEQAAQAASLLRGTGSTGPPRKKA